MTTHKRYCTATRLLIALLLGCVHLSYGATCTTLRVLFAYTPEVKLRTVDNNVNFDVLRDAQKAIDYGNLVLANSGVPYRLELAYIYMVNYDERPTPGHYDDQSAFIKTNDGKMDEVFPLMQQYNADIAFLVLDKMDNGVCGEFLGFMQGTVGTIRWDCMMSGEITTLIHEIGHALGVRHTSGYIAPDKSYQTIMISSKDIKTIIPYFEHPTALTSDGKKRGSTASHNGTTTVTTNMPTRIAKYQPPLNFDIPATTASWWGLYFISAEARNQLTNSTTFTVNNGAKVEFKAGTRIKLKPGFKAHAGSKFKASIGTVVNCTPGLRSVEFEEAYEERPESVSMTAYPNPFTDAATVEYYLPYAQPVELILYDNHGHKAKTLIHKMLQDQGSHQISLEGSELNNGLYFYILKTDEEKELKGTLLLMK